MSTVITNEQYVSTVRNRVAAVARGMLNGDIPFLEGAIELASLRHEAAVEERDPDFMPFAVIESEIDNLPIGAQRKHWSQDALDKHQSEIDNAIIWANEIGTEACQSLIKRFNA
jgi:Protein of unknown function (DUF2489)